MSEAETPPTFPQHGFREETDREGMSLRDWFAGQALVGVGQEYLRRNGFHGDTMFANLATHAYRIADAMLAARRPTQEQG